MAESDNDDFIFIEVNTKNGQQSIQHQIMFEQAQLTQSIISNTAPSVKSMDAWSEISAPSVGSIKSNKSVPYKVTTESSFNIFHTTYLSLPMLPGINNNHSITGSERGFLVISAGESSQENMPIISSSISSQDNQDNNNIATNMNNVSNSIGSIGSRVPFSWAEITKIQPAFHDDNTKAKPKVFDQTPKIRTRYGLKVENDIIAEDAAKSTQVKPECNINNEKPMPAIPESDPFATKADLGRRIRRAGKRGSRLKYPNRRKGTKKNWRKKNPN